MVDQTTYWIPPLASPLLTTKNILPSPFSRAFPPLLWVSILKKWMLNFNFFKLQWNDHGASDFRWRMTTIWSHTGRKTLKTVAGHQVSFGGSFDRRIFSQEFWLRRQNKTWRCLISPRSALPHVLNLDTRICHLLEPPPDSGLPRYIFFCSFQNDSDTINF